MTQGSSSRGFAQSARVALIGGAVSAYALLDAYVLGPVVIELSAWFDPFVVFGVAAAALTLVNVACALAPAPGRRARAGPDRGQARAARLQQADEASRAVDHARLVHIVVLAAVIVNAIFVVGVARFLGGGPVDRRRIMLASAAYSITFAAFFAAVGFGAGDAIRAL